MMQDDHDFLTLRHAVNAVHEKPRLELPDGEDFWVFGYGSLIWHPGFPHVEVRRARLYGYHRRFCVLSHLYRGTPDAPGLVFGLDRGGSCRGLAYRVPKAEGREVMDYLHAREMITGAYNPTWVPLKTDSGPITAATFVVDRSHLQYTGRLEDSKVVSMILQGCGARGTCIEYLRNTVHHLEALDLHDIALHRLLKLAEAHLAEEP